MRLFGYFGNERGRFLSFIYSGILINTIESLSPHFEVEVMIRDDMPVLHIFKGEKDIPTLICRFTQYEVIVIARNDRQTILKLNEFDKAITEIKSILTKL